VNVNNRSEKKKCLKDTTTIAELVTAVCAQNFWLCVGGWWVGWVQCRHCRENGKCKYVRDDSW